MNQDLNRGFSPSACTGHHMYWAGKPDLWIGAGSMFSTLEVLPLFLLVMEAIDQRRHIAERENFPYKLAYLYILGSAFWNFVGAGVFGGGTLNAPLVNYYEHGTQCPRYPRSLSAVQAPGNNCAACWAGADNELPYCQPLGLEAKNISNLAHG